MSISAALVKELRERTGAGMMECKKALVEADGDIEVAAEAMRQKGMAKADKKADRVAAEGKISIAKSDDGKKAFMVEVNCETDFVARGDDFSHFVDGLAKIALDNSITDIEQLMEADLDGKSVDTVRRELISKLGENINVRRLANLETDYASNSYVHGGGQIGVIISAKGDAGASDKASDLLRNLAMHASAMKPQAISYQDLDKDFVEKETQAIRAEIENANDELERLGKPLKRIPDYVSRHQLTDDVLASVEAKMKEDLKEQGKPEQIWDKIVPGQMARYILDNTQLDQEYALLSQTFVMDDKKTVAEAIADVDGSIEIDQYIRFELGEGIEKKEDNFVEEVMAQARGE